MSQFFIVAIAGINTVDLSASWAFAAPCKLSVLGVCLFPIGFSGCILVHYGSTSAFLFTDHGRLSSIVFGQKRIVRAIFPKVVVSVQMAHVLCQGWTWIEVPASVPSCTLNAPSLLSSIFSWLHPLICLAVFFQHSVLFLGRNNILGYYFANHLVLGHLFCLYAKKW